MLRGAVFAVALLVSVSTWAQTTVDTSKINSYVVLNSAIAAASKVNAYVVLCTTTCPAGIIVLGGPSLALTGVGQ